MELPFYHGKISKEECENILISQGKNGSFLLRDSETVSKAYCLCILAGRLIYTYRITQNSDGLYKIQTADGVKENLFNELKHIIEKYEKPNQGLAHHLTYPVYRETHSLVQLQTRQLETRTVKKDETYAEVDDRIYVEVLPS